MKSKSLECALFLASFLLLPKAIAANPPFEIVGLRIGESVADAKKKYPSMRCENSCVLDGQKAFGRTGLLWVGLRDGKISQLAFRFKPAADPETASEVRKFYTKKYGSAANHLGIDGCDEWNVNDGYLALCLSPELSHIWWSTQSRVDVNTQNYRK